MFFGHFDKFWKGRDRQIKKKIIIKKKHAKTCIQGPFTYLENMCLGCVLKELK